MKFYKMQGTGNDFIVTASFAPWASENELQAPGALAKKLCDRHFGIGADGLIIMDASAEADAVMRIYNSDGSRPQMCGNGIRCAAKFLYDSGICPKTELRIETDAGLKTIQLSLEAGKVVSARVDMGAPCFEPKRIPLKAQSNCIELPYKDRALRFYCVSMGNPHAVTFDPIAPEDFETLGPRFEQDAVFPEKTNVEFCECLSDSEIRVRVWERGCGETLACGTGSCAVLAAAASQGLCKRSARLHLPGGVLSDEWKDDGRIYMTGAAETIYIGETI